MTAFTPKPRWICCGQTPCVCLTGKIDMTHSTPEVEKTFVEKQKKIMSDAYLNHYSRTKYVPAFLDTLTETIIHNTLAELKRECEMIPKTFPERESDEFDLGFNQGIQTCLDVADRLLGKEIEI